MNGSVTERAKMLTKYNRCDAVYMLNENVRMYIYQSQNIENDLCL